MKNFIGIDIGGTKCAVVLGNENGEILEKIKFDTMTKDETIAEIIDSIKKLINKDVKGIGISCGGPLDSKKGLILSPPNLPGWDCVPIVEIVKSEFGIPTFIQNDANACAVAEWKFGSGKGCENVIFLTFGTGMGAGLILNNKLYVGRNDNAGEIGHIRLFDDGHIGYGKKGSFEGYCSGGGIAQYGYGSAYEVAVKAKAGDNKAIEIYKEVGRNLGKGLSILMDILNPEVIILGSIYVRDSELLKDTMDSIIQNEVLSTSICPVVPAKLGENIGDIAALCVAMGGHCYE